MINRLFNSCSSVSLPLVEGTLSSVGTLCFSLFQNQDFGMVAFGMSTLVGRNLIPGVLRGVASSIFSNLENTRAAIADCQSAFREAGGALARARQFFGFEGSQTQNSNRIQSAVGHVQTVARVVQTAARGINEVTSIAQAITEETSEHPGFVGTCVGLLGVVALRQTRDVTRLAGLSFQCFVLAVVAIVFYGIIQAIDRRRARNSECLA